MNCASANVHDELHERPQRRHHHQPVIGSPMMLALPPPPASPSSAALVIAEKEIKDHQHHHQHHPNRQHHRYLTSCLRGERDEAEGNNYVLRNLCYYSSSFYFSLALVYSQESLEFCRESRVLEIYYCG